MMARAAALYAGGRSPGAYVARWDGVSWTGVGSLDGGVFSLCVYDDGLGPALYAGGWFSNVDGIPASRIAKWNGVAWSAVGGGISGNPIKAMTVHDGALIVAGQFDMAGGAPAHNVAQWDGGSWSPLAQDCL